MKQQILDFIDEREIVTFADLNLNIAGFTGDQNFTTEELGKLNIWLWSGLSDGAIDAISDLVDNKEIDMRLINPAAYYEAGLVPFIEVAYEQKHYKKPVWLPVAFISKTYS